MKKGTNKWFSVILDGSHRVGCFDDSMRWRLFQCFIWICYGVDPEDTLDTQFTIQKVK